jgi:hypothetical protein
MALLAVFPRQDIAGANANRIGSNWGRCLSSGAILGAAGVKRGPLLNRPTSPTKSLGKRKGALHKSALLHSQLRYLRAIDASLTDAGLRLGL